MGLPFAFLGTGIVDLSRISRRTRIGRFLRLPLRLLPGDLVVRIVQGPNRGLRWIVGSGTHGCWLGTYETVKQQRLAALLRPGDVFYDVGASVGFYTLLASRLVGPSGVVVAFEPLPGNLGFLRRHVELNRCANVRTFEAAVSRSSGSAGFEMTADPHQGHLAEHGALRVETVALDDLITAQILPVPSVIKMDIEGEEVLALEGATEILAKSTPTIFLSTHGRDIHAKCVALLKNLGYDVVSLNGLPVSDTDEIVATRAANPLVERVVSG